MPQGVIKKVVSDRGFGFISADGGDVFFHHTTVAGGGFDGLQIGQTVEFELDNSDSGKGRDKGPRAASVTPT